MNRQRAGEGLNNKTGAGSTHPQPFPFVGRATDCFGYGVGCLPVSIDVHHITAGPSYRRTSDTLHLNSESIRITILYALRIEYKAFLLSIRTTLLPDL